MSVTKVEFVTSRRLSDGSPFIVGSVSSEDGIVIGVDGSEFSLTYTEWVALSGEVERAVSMMNGSNVPAPTSHEGE